MECAEKTTRQTSCPILWATQLKRRLLQMVHNRLVETHYAVKLSHLSITFDYPNVPQENFTVIYNELLKKALGHGFSHPKVSPGLAPSPCARQVTCIFWFYSRSCAHTWQRSPYCRARHSQSHQKGAIPLPPPNPTTQNTLHQRNNESDYAKRNVKGAVETRRERRGKYHPAAGTRGDTHNDSQPGAGRQGVISRFIRQSAAALEEEGCGTST